MMKLLKEDDLSVWIHWVECKSHSTFKLITEVNEVLSELNFSSYSLFCFSEVKSSLVWMLLSLSISHSAFWMLSLCYSVFLLLQIFKNSSFNNICSSIDHQHDVAATYRADIVIFAFISFRFETVTFFPIILHNRTKTFI